MEGGDDARMGKLLPSLGIAAAVAGALEVSVLQDTLAFLAPILVIVAAVFLFPERSSIGLWGGIALIAIALVAEAGLIGSINFKDKGLDLGISPDIGRALAVTACVGVPVVISLARRLLVQPGYLALACWIAAALAVLLAFVGMDNLTNQLHPWSLAVTILALATMAPMFPLLSADPDADPVAPRA